MIFHQNDLFSPKTGQLQISPKWSFTKMIETWNRGGGSWKFSDDFKCAPETDVPFCIVQNQILWRQKNRNTWKINISFAKRAFVYFVHSCVKIPVEGAFRKGISHCEAPYFFEFERLLCVQLQTSPIWSFTKMIFSDWKILRFTKMILHFSVKCL